MKLYPYAQYRPVGAGWLGHVPSEWEVRRLKFTASVIMGQSPSSESYVDQPNELPFLQGNAEFGTLCPTPKWFCDAAPKRIPPGALLLSVRAPVGAVNKSDQSYGIGRGLCGIVDVGLGLSNDFAWFLMQACSGELHKQATGSTYEAVSVSDVENTFIPLPPEDQQSQIVAYLEWKIGQIDNLITRKKLLLAKLKEKRLAIITQAVTRGLDPKISMHNSGIPWVGRIPRHWKLMRLRFVVERIEQGWSPQCDNQPAEEDCWGVMKVGCVNGNRFTAIENKALPLDLEPLEIYELKPKDILVSRANTRELLGSAAVVPNDVRSKLLLCDKLFRIKTPRGIDDEYLTYYLRTPLARFQYEREATGASSSMQNIGQSTIKNLVVPLPPLEEQNAICQAIHAGVSTVDAMSVATETAIDRLTEYRSALITAAVTGKIDVRDVKIPANV